MTLTETDELEPQLLLELSDEPARLRRRQAVLTSILVHTFVVFAFVVQHRVYPPAPPAKAKKPDQHVTLLFPTPKVLTQKDPNRGPVSKMFLGEQQPVRPPLLLNPKAIPSPPTPQPLAKADLGRVEKPPELSAKPELPAGAIPTIPQQPIAPQQAPKLTLEDANKAGTGKPDPKLMAQTHPGSIVEGAVRDIARQGGTGGAAVGDGISGGTPDGFTLPSRGNVGSNIELLSDPQGVDFRPYLARILAMVRRNWYAVIPESARLGMVRGRVVIQFIVIKQGSVSKLVIAGASGYEALDRAAVAGISASNPFPPLPTEFRGDQVRLQFVFLYNIAVR